jgi:hypothetical protein
VNKSGGGVPAWALATRHAGKAKVHREIQRRSRADERICRRVARRFNIMTAPAPPVERQRRV